MLKLMLLKYLKQFLRWSFSIFVFSLLIFMSPISPLTFNPLLFFQAIQGIYPGMMMAGIGLGILISAWMTRYDYRVLAKIHPEQLNISFWKLSFASNALNNILGICGIAGASTRRLFLQRLGLSDSDIDQGIAWVSTASPGGLSILSILTLAYFGMNLEEFQPMALLLIGSALYLPALGLRRNPLWFSPENLSKLPSKKLLAQLLWVSFVDWSLTAGAFSLLTLLFVPDVSMVSVFTVYVIAASAGALGLTPGGIVLFDTAALLGLSKLDIPIEVALVVVLLFRLWIHWIPGAVGMTILLLQDSPHLKQTLLSQPLLERLGSLRFLGKPFETSESLRHFLMSLLVGAAGAVLLISAIKPGIPARVLWETGYLPLEVLAFSQSASVAIAMMLMVLSIEVFYRVQRSYQLSRILLTLGACFTFLKGMDYEEGLFLMGVFCLLSLGKKGFHRIGLPVRLSRTVFMALVGLVGILVYGTLNQAIYENYLAHHLYPPKLFGNNWDSLFPALGTYLGFVGFIAYLHLSKIPIEKDPQFMAPDLERLARFLPQCTGDALTHLVFLGDKNIFWDSTGKVAIPYAKYNDAVVALGDPLGNPDFFSRGIREFQGFMDAYGYDVSFYEISDRYLPLYHENGFSFFKLGEEAIIDLQSFSLAGASKSNQRHGLNSFEKRGFQFEICQPPFDNALLKACWEVSEDWLSNRPEMGFSMGWFQEAYLQRAPMALLKNPDGSLLAFVSIMPSYDGGESVSTDLMRIRSGAPHGTMDVLLLRLALHFQASGYRYFNLGMAPLSKVGENPKCHLREKMARIVYRHGHFFYSFDGLRKYKEKYQPIWKPRYLAYPQLLSLPAVLIELSMLVSSRRKHRNQQLVAATQVQADDPSNNQENG